MARLPDAGRVASRPHYTADRGGAPTPRASAERPDCAPPQIGERHEQQRARQHQRQHQPCRVGEARAAEHQREDDRPDLVGKGHQGVAVDDGHEHGEKRQARGGGEIAGERRHDGDLAGHGRKEPHARGEEAECGERVARRPDLERMLVRSGIRLYKYWFSVTQEEQRRRFNARKRDPLKQWKLSPIDEASLEKWDDYTEAKEAMFFYTDTADAPWTIIKSDDKKRARINCMIHFLNSLPYPGKDTRLVKAPDARIVGSGGHVIGNSAHILGKSLHPDQRRS